MHSTQFLTISTGLIIPNSSTFHTKQFKNRSYKTVMKDGRRFYLVSFTLSLRPRLLRCSSCRSVHLLTTSGCLPTNAACARHHLGLRIDLYCRCPEWITVTVQRFHQQHNILTIPPRYFLHFVYSVNKIELMSCNARRDTIITKLKLIKHKPIEYSLVILLKHLASF